MNRTPYFLILICLTIFFKNIQAQTIAQDWTKTDCSGNTHQLYTDLDNGKIVIMEFIMLGCGPCITASAYVEQIYQDYKISHPNRVLVYAMSYDQVSTCSQLESWKSAFSVTYPSIARCAADVDFYGGMGMPTVVVAGGSNHKILYKTIGWTGTSDGRIRSELDIALAATSVKEIEANNFTVFPNPATNYITISNDKLSMLNYSAELFDSGGNIVNAENITNSQNNLLKINTSKLNNGIYILKLSSSEEFKTIKFTVFH